MAGRKTVGRAWVGGWHPLPLQSEHDNCEDEPAREHRRTHLHPPAHPGCTHKGGTKGAKSQERRWRSRGAAEEIRGRACACMSSRVVAHVLARAVARVVARTLSTSALTRPAIASISCGAACGRGDGGRWGGDRGATHRRSQKRCCEQTAPTAHCAGGYPTGALSRAL